MGYSYYRNSVGVWIADISGLCDWVSQAQEEEEKGGTKAILRRKHMGLHRSSKLDFNVFDKGQNGFISPCEPTVTVVAAARRKNSGMVNGVTAISEGGEVGNKLKHRSKEWRARRSCHRRI